MFSCFSSIRTVESKLKYYDFPGEMHQALGKTGGQQGDEGLVPPAPRENRGGKEEILAALWHEARARASERESTVLEEHEASQSQERGVRLPLALY